MAESSLPKSSADKELDKLSSCRRAVQNEGTANIRTNILWPSKTRTALLEGRKWYTPFPYTTLEEFEEGSPDDAEMWLVIQLWKPASQWKTLRMRIFVIRRKIVMMRDGGRRGEARGTTGLDSGFG
jgi:hypothetical protein